MSSTILIHSVFKLALVACVLLSGPTLQVEARSSLRTSQTETGFLSAKNVQQSLVAELTALLGHGAHHDRLVRLQAELQQMYVALPKNAHGHLEHGVVRYALHRYFVQKHGWFIKGLEPDGEAWSASSPVAIMKDNVPSYIQGLFEQRLGELGFGLQELAIFAATLEDLVHSGVIERLQAVSGMLGLATNSHERWESEQVSEAVGVYMMSYILGQNVSQMRSMGVHDLSVYIKHTYPGWKDTLIWLHDVQKTVEFAELGRSNPFNPKSSRMYDFAFTARVIETIEDKYVNWQNLECQGIKEMLLGIEDQGTGRVPLSKFYGQSDALFTETVDYLRDLGALDESDRARPTVVIPNYLSGPANCLATSSVYSICCLNECESLMAHLEREVGAPTTDTQRIIELISALPSDTVDAPRNVSGPLRSRLEQIALSHDGKVPLHGRLFAQWMHHAYPHECPYPHLSGTTSPLTAAEWSLKVGVNPDATNEEMDKHIGYGREDQDSVTPEAKVEALPWTAEEELLVARGVSHTSYIMKGLALLTALAAFATALSSLKGVGSQASAKEALPIFKAHMV